MEKQKNYPSAANSKGARIKNPKERIQTQKIQKATFILRKAREGQKSLGKYREGRGERGKCAKN